jgi:hypothetical protein
MDGLQGKSWKIHLLADLHDGHVKSFTPFLQNKLTGDKSPLLSWLLKVKDMLNRLVLKNI